MSKYSGDIESFMLKDDLEGLIRFLKVLQETDDSVGVKLSSIAGRLAKLESDRSLGVLSQDDYSKERNQIRYGIIQLSNEIEIKTKKSERKEKKKKKLLRILKKYGTIGVFSVLVIFFSMKIYVYYAYVNNINLPYKYIGKDIDKESINSMYKDMERDSSIGNERFNYIIEYLYSVSNGKDNYIEFNDLDSTHFDKIISSESFEEEFNGFIKELNKNKITLSSIYEEIEYEEQLRDEILYEKIQEEYSIIDQICTEIQDEYDRKEQLAENLMKNIEVSLFNVKINRSKKRLEARKSVRNGSGQTVHSVESRLYIIDRNSLDTLCFITVSIDDPAGINTVYRQSLEYFSAWDQASIYNSIKNYESSDLIFTDELIQANVDGESYDVSYDYSPSQLPHGAYTYTNYNYRTLDTLKGICSYLRYDNKTYQEARENVEELVKDNLKHNGHLFNPLFKELKFYK